MKPLIRFLRWHHAVSAVFVVAMPLAFAWFVGSEAIWTVVGWSVAVGWTVSASVEVMALAGERWWRNVAVQRSTWIISLIMLAITFANMTWMMIDLANLRRLWVGPSLATVVHTVVTGRYEHMAFVAAMALVQWLSLVATAVTVRTLWRRGAPGLVGRPTKLFVIIVSLLLGIMITDGLGPMMYRLRFYGFEVYDDVFAIVFRGPILMALVPFLWFLNVRFSLGWLTQMTSLEAAWTILAASATTLIPFVYGTMFYGSTWSQLYTMKPWYMLAALLVPIVLWGWSLVFRSRGTPGVDRP